MAKRTLLTLIFSVLVLGVPLASHAWATHYFGSNLRYGMTGTEVSFLQEYLQVQGYFHYPSITEYFGPVTLGAVKAWQAANGIPSTGFFGPISRAFTNETSTDPVIVTTTTLATTTVATTTDPSGPSYPSLSPPFAPTNIIFEGVPGPAVSSSASNGPTGYWPLDEGTGTIAYDASGNALNGTWYGTQSSASGTYYTAGLIGSSAGYFDGSDDYIEMSSSTLFNSQTVTMSAWIYPTADSVQSTIMGKEEQYKVVIKNGQIGILSTCDGLEWDTNQYVSSNVPLDAWTYVAFVMNGPGGVDQVYENGTLVATVANCGEITNFNSNPFEIGGYAGAQAAFTGAIDDARFYTRALTASEVQALYDAVTSPVAISISPTSTEILSGATTTFSATVLDAANTAVTWSATLGTINASGTYTAPTLASSTSIATDTVTAMSVADNTKIATATVIITNGLADWWKLSEGTGTVAVDSVNAAHDGTWYGPQSSASSTHYSTSVPSSSYPYAYTGSFDGSDNYIDPSLTMDYSTTSTFTWSVWVDLATGINGDNVILGDRGYNPWIKLTPTAFEYGSGPIINNTIPLNQWEFISVVKSGTNFYYYQDGVLMGSATSSVTGTDVPFFIGTDPGDTGDGYTKGSVGDVRIYDVALTQGEVQNLYDAVSPQPVTISITPTSTTLASGDSQTFDATVSNASNTAVTWSTLYGTINASGTYTAPSVVTSSLTDIVTATAVASSSQVATATITVVPPGLAVWLPLDEGTGTVANDISGNGNNGTWSGTMASASGTYYTPGIVGNYAGVFSTDGTTKISLTSPSALVGNAAKTMLLWFNPSALRGTEQDIAEFGDNTTGGEFGLELGNDEHINAHLGVSDFESPVVAATGTWYFAALTYDGSVTSLYVNGTLEATSSATLNTGDANFFIGQHLVYTGLYFAGDVDDVRVYTRALPQSEIQEIYDAYAPPPVSVSITPTSTSLLADATTSFAATVSNASNTAVTWSAVYGSIDSSGVYTAPSSTASSTITDTITATSVADNTKIATATVTVTPGLLGWWPTREGSGSIAYDVSGNGMNGTWHGTQMGNSGYYETYGSSTYTGAFDGSDNYVSTTVSWPTSGSMSVWVDPSGVSSWSSPAGWKYAPSSGGYILMDEGSSGNWRAVFNASGLGEVDIQSTSSIAADTWSHLVMTWNKVGTTTTLALYVNDVLQGSTSTTQTATSSIGSFYYGTGGQSANNDFWGYINDVRVYDRALLPSEIQEIYNAERPANSSTPGALINPSA